MPGSPRFRRGNATSIGTGSPSSSIAVRRESRRSANSGTSWASRSWGSPFVWALSQEARIAHEIFSAQGFDVASALCKVGRIPKEEGLDVKDEEKIMIGTPEAACNPIVQAKVLNRIGTDLNVLLGLCVGHDSLFFKYADAYTTVLAVKDRVTGHNPLAALYTSHMYHMYLKQPGF